MRTSYRLMKWCYYLTINILDSDWTKHYFTLHFKMWLSPLKSAREVNITFEHCSVYPKIVTGKVQVAYYPLANEVARGYSNATVRPSVCHNPCEHSRNKILQWILTKLGTYLVLKRIWNPIDFQGQVKGQGHGSNFYRITSLWTL